MIDYIHAGVFVPVFNVAAANERFCFSPLTNPSMKLAYWDEGAYANELAVSSGVEEKAKASNLSTGVSGFDEAAAAAEKKGLVPPGDGDAKNKKRKAEQSAKLSSKKVCVSVTYVVSKTYSSRLLLLISSFGATATRSFMELSQVRMLPTHLTHPQRPRRANPKLLRRFSPTPT